MINFKNITLKILLLIGLFLLTLNSAGLFIPLKNKEIYTELNNGFKDDTILTPRQSFELLEKYSPPSSINDITAINNVFNKSIAHYWENSGIKKYHITVPAYHNYILYSLQFIKPTIYKKYEFCDYTRIINRGVGLCSQHAIAVTDFLEKQGIRSNLLLLDGHVVITLISAKKSYILDPDFGVVLPYSIEEVENNPAIIIPFYKNNLPKINFTMDKLLDIYGKEGNIIYPVGVNGYIDCNSKKIIIEKLSYILIWVIPLLLMLPFTIHKLKKKYAK